MNAVNGKLRKIIVMPTNARNPERRWMQNQLKTKNIETKTRAKSLASSVNISPNNRLKVRYVALNPNSDVSLASNFFLVSFKYSFNWSVYSSR